MEEKEAEARRGVEIPKLTHLAAPTSLLTHIPESF
jgi:hypothetical protein